MIPSITHTIENNRITAVTACSNSSCFRSIYSPPFIRSDERTQDREGRRQPTRETPTEHTDHATESQSRRRSQLAPDRIVQKQRENARRDEIAIQGARRQLRTDPGQRRRTRFESGPAGLPDGDGSGSDQATDQVMLLIGFLNGTIIFPLIGQTLPHEKPGRESENNGPKNSRYTLRRTASERFVIEG